MSFHQIRSPYFNNQLAGPDTVSSAAITGTATASIVQNDIISGGKTIIITLTGDTWVQTSQFDAIRQDIINGLDSAQSEGTGWDAVVKAGQTVGGVIRTSDTIVTITLDAFPTYNITVPETITVTVPGSAVFSSVSIVGSPTFTVDLAAATSIKTFNGLAYASTKTKNGLAIASIKNANGLT